MVSRRKASEDSYFDTASEAFPSTSRSSSPKRRRPLAINISRSTVETNLGENDDESERLTRQERNDSSGFTSTSSPSQSFDNGPSNTLQLSSMSNNISATEMNEEIALCIKMNSENKINDKNAFQLKMIDFLVHILKKHDPKMNNLQMATASLDASANIYGFRVDRVHSDLLKMIGVANQNKRDNPNEDSDFKNTNERNSARRKRVQLKKKKKEKQIISTVDALKGNVKTYDPLSLMRQCRRDTQTSDMLFQASLFQHANQGVGLNLYDDVILDKIPNSSSVAHNKFSTPLVEDFTNLKMCPSYADFKFLGWCPDNNDTNERNNDGMKTGDNDGEFHFDLDANIEPDDEVFENDAMDCGDAFEERCNRLARESQPVENIIDFQDIIANSTNSNATYEYSYLDQDNRTHIHRVGSSHWKIKTNKNIEDGGSSLGEKCQRNAKKKKKDIKLEFTADAKEEARIKFEQIGKGTKILHETVRVNWWQANNEAAPLLRQDVQNDLFKRYCAFFNKENDNLKRLNSVANTDNHRNDDIVNDYSFDLHRNDHDTHRDQEIINNAQDNAIVAHNRAAFEEDNLVAVPKLTEKLITVPYSQNAKKVNMHELKGAVWKHLKRRDNQGEDIDTNFSTVYNEIPSKLSEVNAKSLSPAIAFMSLLQVASEKNLQLDGNPDLSDITIRKGKSNE